jgi:hypothetical protein
MALRRAWLPKANVFYLLGRATVCLLLASLQISKAGAQESPNAQQSGPSPQSPTQVPQAAPPPPPLQFPVAAYDKAIFQNRIPSDQLTFLNQFAGAPAKDLLHDKQYRKIIKAAIPNCTFHYGRDMSLSDALDMVFGGSKLPVDIRDGRYLTVSGMNGPYLAGRGFIWIDLQDGIVLGGFYFHPTNGEPTPALNIFSKQIVKQDYLLMSQLPPAFAGDLIQWSTASRVPPVAPRYFLTGSNKKILLVHNEDYCMFADGTMAPPASGCQQMDAEAADIDMDSADYLEQTHHATNATAWMINGPDQVAWLQVRATTCGRGPDPLGCRIRLTRERTYGILGGHPMPHPPHR